MSRAPLYFLVILISGCELLISDDPSLSLKTDRAEYELTTADTIRVEVKNISSSSVYFSTCMPALLEERRGREIIATLPFPVCYCLCTTELEFGETWSYSVPIAWIEMNRDRFSFKEDNVYRFQLAFYEDRSMKTPLSKQSLYTSDFILRR